MTNIMRILQYEKARVIEFIIGLVSLLSGMYLMSPLHIPDLSTLTQQTPDLGIKIYGILYITGSVLLLIGVIKDRVWYRRVGKMIMFILTWYIIALIWIDQGLRPITWVWAFTVATILTYLFVVDREIHD